MFWLVMDVSVMKSNSSLIVMMATPRFSKNSGEKDPGQSRTTPDLLTSHSEQIRQSPAAQCHLTIHITAVLPEELQSMRMIMFHGLRHINDVDISVVVPADKPEPQKTVAQNQRTFLKGSTYSMLNSLRSAWTRRAS